MTKHPRDDSRAIALRAKLREKASQRGRGGQPQAQDRASRAVLAQDALLRIVGDDPKTMQAVCAVLKDGKLTNPFGKLGQWADEEEAPP